MTAHDLLKEILFNYDPEFPGVYMGMEGGCEYCMGRSILYGEATKDTCLYHRIEMYLKRTPDGIS